MWQVVKGNNNNNDTNIYYNDCTLRTGVPNLTASLLHSTATRKCCRLYILGKYYDSTGPHSSQFINARPLTRPSTKTWSHLQTQINDMGEFEQVVRNVNARSTSPHRNTNFTALNTPGMAIFFLNKNYWLKVKCLINRVKLHIKSLARVGMVDSKLNLSSKLLMKGNEWQSSGIGYV